jgi:5-methyltetrahydrofolate--homocysteine methyltransferase
MTSAIMNPCRPQEMEAVRGANVLMGTDRDCMTWIRTYRDYTPTLAAGPKEVSGEAAQANATAAAAEGGGRRRGGREARRGTI